MPDHTGLVTTWDATDDDVRVTVNLTRSDEVCGGTVSRGEAWVTLSLKSTGIMRPDGCPIECTVQLAPGDARMLILALENNLARINVRDWDHEAWLRIQGYGACQ